MKSQPSRESPNSFQTQKEISSSKQEFTEFCLCPNSQRQHIVNKINDICGLGARFGYVYKRVFKPPRLKSQISFILFNVCVSLSCCNPELFLLPPRNSIFSAFLQLMSVNQVHDQDNKNNCD